VKADRTDKLWGGVFSTGAKLSYVKSSNIFQQDRLYPTGETFDSLQSNNFLYKENINAAYVNFSKKLKKISFQLGLRAENTNIKGSSSGYKPVADHFAPYDSSFQLHYTNFFPSGSFSVGDPKASQWMVSYSYRIDRPAYRDLNPFRFRLDDYSVREGNTQLRPQYSHSATLTYSYRQQLTATFGYSHISDLFTTLTDTIDVSKSVLKRINLASQDIISLNLSYPFQWRWYSAFASVSSSWSMYRASFGPGRNIDLNAFSVNANLNQTFRLGSGWSGEMTAFYNSPAILQGTYKSKSIWSLDAAVQKAVFRKNGSVSMGVSDIFRSLKYSATSNFAGQNVFARGGSETRLFKVSLTYRLGSATIKGARQRKVGTEEEGRRTNN
jgi:iron complex outermembrane receptor protein